MKVFCDSLMKLNPSMPFGDDFSPIVLTLFLKERGYKANQRYNIYDYACYLYRFYSDEKEMRMKHYNKMINEIGHYTPNDFVAYAKSVLEHISVSTGLIILGSSEFVLANCPDDVEKYKTVINGVIITLVSKYMGKNYCSYEESISEDEMQGNIVYSPETRVFNRAIENINYCFICDEYHKQNLRAIQLRDKHNFDVNNYLVLCDKHAKMFQEKRLIIKKNGYPYIDGIREYQHLEISLLKKLRTYLQEIEE